MALYSPAAADIASDSRAFVDKANLLITKTRSKRRDKPFGIVPDGDLWKHFYDAASHKGFNAIRIGWTKGHAKDIHIAQGLSTPFCKIQNDIADTVADRGISIDYEAGIIAIAHYIMKRREEQIAIVVRIQKAILRALRAEKERKRKQRS